MNKEPKKPFGKKKYLLLGLGFLLGLILLLYGSFGGERQSETVDALPTAEGYRRELTKEIEALCEKVQGVGRVTVLVSLEGGYEYVYAKDADGDCVSIGSGSGKQAVVQNILPPKLLGVGIVCDGGEDAACRAALTELLSAALGIGSNKIYITS